MSELKDGFFCLEHIVLQPTTACNMNCEYCYLPLRKKNLKMQRHVIEHLTTSLDELELNRPLPLIWHGGEPLMYGVKQFAELIEPLEQLRRSKKILHSVQTNATLIDDQWAEFFKYYEFEVGVSLDGPETLNTRRVDWHKKEMFTTIVKGIESLKTGGVEFTCIVVVSNKSLMRAAEIYKFFCELGCTSLGINIEENLGINSRSAHSNEVSLFWDELFKEWYKNPVLQIREFSSIIAWMNLVTRRKHSRRRRQKTDIFPTIGWDGTVSLLSPELLGAKSFDYGDFIAGNILQDSLTEILIQAQKLRYVQEHRLGIKYCQSTCKFFDSCGGGQASNKFFELGVIAGTETAHCQNVHQKPMETFLRYLEQSDITKQGE